MFLELRKDFGDRMALVKRGEGEAVLILIDRIEKEGPFFTIPGETYKYPVIRFERPPELCGVEEPSDQEEYEKLHKVLRKKFIEALVALCKENSITTVVCADTTNLNAQPYRDALLDEKIYLGDFLENVNTGSKILN